MSTKSERESLAKKINEVLIPSCCNGNKSAEAYLRRIFFLIRTLDDLEDGDVETSKADIFKSYFILLGDFQTNSFYREHQDKLNAAHIIGYNAWLDANQWLNEKNKLKNMYAHVFRDTICEIIPLVAFLTGGWNSMRKISLEMRTVFLKELGE